MGAPGSPPSFPRLTWVQCECGCGWEGSDEVTEWLVAEAVLMRQRVLENRAADAAGEDSAREARLMSMASGVFRGGR